MTWKIDAQEAAAARGRLHGARTVLMPTHQNVDADGLSAPIAMRHALAQVGVDAYPMITDGSIPSSLMFLPDIESVLIYGKDPLPDYDLICTIDCADRRRLGQFSRDAADKLDGSFPIVNIDHHVTNDRFGVVNIVIPEAAAAAEIVTASPIRSSIHLCFGASLMLSLLLTRPEVVSQHRSAPHVRCPAALHAARANRNDVAPFRRAAVSSAHGASRASGAVLLS